ncbi:MAG: macro domain-containing protein [Firmicutes bacterium]|nr:macro domain-containing protein [Bacillota bacterium]
MKIDIKKTGITKLPVDCIVNAANTGLLQGGGVCGAIFREAGAWKLQRACDEYGYCPTGSAVITLGFKLPAKYVIHAVGPMWQGGTKGEEQQLYDCYQASMKLAQENDCHTIAFPLISSGIYGYPKQDAWKVALRSVSDYQAEHPGCGLDVTFAVLDDKMYDMGNAVLESL